MSTSLYTGSVRTLRLIEGAREARGLCVIIDVFRAFSLECYLYDRGAALVRPVGSVEDTLALHRKLPGSVLIGERGGAKIDGFDYGNSPSTVPEEAVKGRIVLHTTSAGTQGVVNAVHADEIITGSLVNAKAIAAYIAKKQPDEVSLVCMGLAGKEETDEDTLCARYIKSILENQPLTDLQEQIDHLKLTDGAKFFDPAQQDVFPQRDFELSTQADRFDFVLRYNRETGCMDRIG